jgi:hypothetical protein
MSNGVKEKNGSTTSMDLPLNVREALRFIHRQHRDGDESTFEHGLNALRDVVKHIPPTSANAQLAFDTVRDVYVREVLKAKKDSPPLVPIGNGAFIIHTAKGDIAIAPRRALEKPEVKGALLTLIDEHDAPDDAFPHLPTLSQTYLRRGTPCPFSFHEDGSLALARGMRVLLDINACHLETTSLEGFFLGSFSLAEPTRAALAKSDDARLFFDVGQAHIEEALRIAASAIDELTRIMQIEMNIQGKEPGSDHPVTNWRGVAQAVKPLWFFCKDLHKAFYDQLRLAHTWEYRFIAQQIAKLNNVLTAVYGVIVFGEDIFFSDIDCLATSLRNLFDPIDHIMAVFVTQSDSSSYFRIRLNDASQDDFKGRKSAALRFLINKIVYHAGLPEDGVRKGISFTFEDETFTVRDLWSGQALAAFDKDTPGRQALEEIALSMGHGTRIEFADEIGEDGMLMLQSIRICAPADDDGAGNPVDPHGDKTGNEGARFKRAAPFLMPPIPAGMDIADPEALHATLCAEAGQPSNITFLLPEGTMVSTTPAMAFSAPLAGALRMI